MAKELKLLVDVRIENQTVGFFITKDGNVIVDTKAYRYENRESIRFILSALENELVEFLK